MMKASDVYLVIGMPYSDTALLSSLMGTHSEVYGGADPKRDYGEYRRNYYMQTSDAFRLDNKYEDIFSAETIDRIQRTDAYQAPLAQLDLEEV